MEKEMEASLGSRPVPDVDQQPKVSEVRQEEDNIPEVTEEDGEVVPPEAKRARVGSIGGASDDVVERSTAAEEPKEGGEGEVQEDEPAEKRPRTLSVVQQRPRSKVSWADWADEEEAERAEFGQFEKGKFGRKVAELSAQKDDPKIPDFRDMVPAPKWDVFKRGAEPAALPTWVFDTIAIAGGSSTCGSSSDF